MAGRDYAAASSPWSVLVPSRMRPLGGAADLEGLAVEKSSGGGQDLASGAYGAVKVRKSAS